MVDYVKLGRRIRMKRTGLKLTQEEVARSVSVSTSFYGHIERGTRVPSLDTLVSLANFLGVGLDCLMCDSLQNDNAPQMTADEARFLRQFLEQQITEIDFMENVSE